MKQIQYEELIKCECGCNQLLNKYDKYGRSRRFIKEHVSRKYPPLIYKGKNHYNWKGGKYKTSDGYIYILKKDHPHCNNQGYIPEHRYIYEQYYNCCLLKSTDIDHKDRNKLNNKIENLIARSHSNHKSYHNKGNQYNKKDMSNRICVRCKSNNTYIDNKGKSHWRFFKKEISCLNCHYWLLKSLRSS